MTNTVQVTRTKVYPAPGKNPRFAWKSVYSVTIPGERFPFVMETKSQVKSLCKRKAPTMSVHYEWEQ